MDELFYDERDDRAHEARGSQILYWLDDLGAKPISEATGDSNGFLFAGARSIEDYHQLVEKHPHIQDRPADREPLLQLDTVLGALNANRIQIPTPDTWYLPLDEPIPGDIHFPLFVRTAQTSLKLGGRISKVTNRDELEAECSELRRALGWDALILARKWHDFATAGPGRYGPVPQEIRVWIIDGVPFAWTFHHLHIVPQPQGFPPSTRDLATLKDLATLVARAFSSRAIVADFACDQFREWVFIEAGPASCAGTAHEQVFKAVANKLIGKDSSIENDQCGGLF